MSKTTTNYAQQSNFIFKMTNSIKEVEFGIVSWSGCGVTLNSSPLKWQSVDNKRPGDDMSFNDINLTVLLDENFEAFVQAFDFMKTFKNQVTSSIGNYSENTFSGILLSTNNRNRFNKIFTFSDCWINSISDLNFTSTQTTNEPMTFNISLVFDYYEIKDA